MKMLRNLFVLSATLMLVGAGCSGSKSANSPSSSAAAPQGPLTLTSSAFADGQAIPDKYTCSGQDFSPPVTFSNVPRNAVSLALIMEDTDTPYDHWTLFNISPGQAGIAEGDVPPGSAGNTTGGKLGYEGPCPSDGKMHHYALSLYALKDVVNLQDGASKEDVRKAFEGKVIAETKITGTYGK